MIIQDKEHVFFICDSTIVKRHFKMKKKMKVVEKCWGKIVGATLNM